MKAIIITLICLIIGLNIQGQENSTTPSRKEQREQKRAQKEAQMQVQIDSIAKLIDTKQFVLEADFLRDRKGRRIHVMSNLNFVKVDTTSSVIQTGNGTGFGYNGVGGLTAEGRINRWKVDKNDKKKTIYIEMSVNSNIGMYDLFLYINADGNASATLSGLRNYEKVEFEGKIVPLEESGVFKGRTL